MSTYIALLRGINIGGHHKLPMKELVAVLEALGLRNVQTCIQSGNAVFQAQTGSPGQLAAKISAAIKKSHGFEPKTMLLDVIQLDQAIRDNPFPEGETPGNTLHLSFLAEAPAQPDLAGIETIRAKTEKCLLQGKVFYLYAPDGVARSKLAASMERLLGVPITSRNWNTVKKLQEMAQAR